MSVVSVFLCVFLFEHVTTTMVNLGLVQALAAFVSFAVCFAGGVAPMRFDPHSSGLGLSFASCFGGGILLGAGLVHLLVQAEEDAVLSSYPLGHVLAVCGFLGAFLLEKVAFGHAHSHGHAEEHGAHPDGGVELRMLHHVPHKHAKHMHHHHHHPEHEGEETPACVEEHDSAEHDMVVDLCEEDHGIPLLEGDDDDDAIDADGGSPEQSMLAGSAGGHHQHHHGEASTESYRLAWVLFGMLALENFVGGSAVGFQENRKDVLITTLAIVTHVWAESFSLGVNFSKAGATKMTLLKVETATEDESMRG